MWRFHGLATHYLNTISGGTACSSILSATRLCHIGCLRLLIAMRMNIQRLHSLKVFIRRGVLYGVALKPASAVYTVSLAAIIFFAGLTIAMPHFGVIVSVVILAWSVCVYIGRGLGSGVLSLSRPLIVTCVVLGLVFTIDGLVAILFGEGGFHYTASNFFNRWGTNMIWLAALVAIATVFMHSSRQRLQTAIRIALATHIAGFISQIVWYYSTGQVLDLSGLLGGQSARTTYLHFFRPSGFNTEPSLFAGVVIVLLTCDALVARKVSVSLTIAVAALCLVSFSTAAWLFAACLLLAVLPIATQNKTSLLVSSSAVIVALVLVLQSHYAAVQIDKFWGTVGLRIAAISSNFDRPALQNLVGPLVNGPSLEYLSKIGKLGGDRVSASASGLGTPFYLALRYGAIGVLAYIAFFIYAYRRLSLSVGLLLGIATVTKIVPSIALFVILAATAMLEMFRRKDQSAQKSFDSNPTSDMKSTASSV